MEEPEQPKAKPEKAKKNIKKPLMMVIVAVILLAAGAAAGYWYRGTKADKQAKQLQQQIDDKQKKLTQSEKDLAAEKAKTTKETTTTTKTTTTSTAPSASAIENIKASITSGNTAALEGYMASKVTVIIAASEGIGSRTPAQAVGDITSYISGATDPWNFALPAATVNGWAAGFYAQYFPTGAVVGKSADGHVISFSFDSTGKISTVFMAASDTLL